MSNKKNLNQNKKCTYFVEGMHCASCEVLIEKTLLEKDGVDNVEVSLKDSKLNFELASHTDINEGDLNNMFKDSGYKFFKNRKTQKNNGKLISFNSSGQVEINSSKLKKLLSSVLILIFIIIALLIIEKLQLGGYMNVSNTTSYPAFMLLGLFAGISTCGALVGGLLLSMSKQWNELYITEHSQWKKFVPHLLFHSGRILGFMVFGVVLGILGLILQKTFDEVSQKYIYLNSFLVIAVCILMLILALQMLEVGWAKKISITSPKSLKKAVANESNFKGKLMPFFLGFSTILLACGITILVYAAAFSSADPLSGMLITLSFALGTLIPLLIISLTSVKLNSRPSLTAKFNKIAGLMILVFAIYTVNAQLNILGLPSLSDINLGSNNEIIEAPNEVDGVQKISIVAKDFEYVATSSTTLVAWVPTVLEVDNQGVEGCAIAIAARGLFDGYTILEPGINKIEFTPQPGSYKLTCTMGMVKPIVITVV